MNEQKKEISGNKCYVYCLGLVIDGTKVIPEALGFAFDQFSLMLKKHKNLDKSLLVSAVSWELVNFSYSNNASFFFCSFIRL